MKAVIYARYSSSAQREESIEGQVKECAAYAERNGYTVIKTYADRAISGTTDNRPQFQKMIEDSKRKPFDFIIVWKLDRFARNRYDSAKYKAQLKKLGIKVIGIPGTIENLVKEYMVEFKDSSVKAQLGLPDMHLPIRYALGFPKRLESKCERMKVTDYANLTFEEPDYNKFPLLGMAFEAMKKAGNVPCVLNAANEVVNLAFREGRCGFMQMSDVIAKTMEKTMFITEPTYEDYVETDKEARKIALELLKL